MCISMAPILTDYEWSGNPSEPEEKSLLNAVWPSGSVEARLSLSTDFFSQMGL